MPRPGLNRRWRLRPGLAGSDTFCPGCPPISGAAIDLDPSNGGTVVESGAVSLLYDASGNGLNATQGTSGQRPTFNATDADFGGRSSLSYDATNDRLVVSNYQPGGGGSLHTIYVVIKTNGTTGFKSIFGHNTGGGTGRLLVAQNGASLNLNFSNPGGSSTGMAISIAANTVYRLAAACDFSDGADPYKEVYLNGVSQAISYFATSAANTASMDAANAGVGADQGGTFGFFDGKLARITGYSAQHSTAQIETTDAWMESWFTL